MDAGIIGEGEKNIEWVTEWMIKTLTRLGKKSWSQLLRTPEAPGVSVANLAELGGPAVQMKVTKLADYSSFQLKDLQRWICFSVRLKKFELYGSVGILIFINSMEIVSNTGWKTLRLWNYWDHYRDRRILPALSKFFHNLRHCKTTRIERSLSDRLEKPTWVINFVRSHFLPSLATFALALFPGF